MRHNNFLTQQLCLAPLFSASSGRNVNFLNLRPLASSSLPSSPLMPYYLLPPLHLLSLGSSLNGPSNKSLTLFDGVVVDVVFIVSAATTGFSGNPTPVPEIRAMSDPPLDLEGEVVEGMGTGREARVTESVFCERPTNGREWGHQRGNKRRAGEGKVRRTESPER